MINKDIRVINNKVNSNDMTVDELNSTPDSYFTNITIVDQLENSKEGELLALACNKVKSGGVLRLNGVDALDICRRVYYGEIGLNEISNNFFSRVKSLHSITTLKDYFLKKKWDIMFIGVKDGRYTVEVKKP